MKKWIFYKAKITFNKNIKMMYENAYHAQDHYDLSHFINVTNDNLTCDMADSCSADWEDYQVWITKINKNVMEVSFSYADKLKQLDKDNVMEEILHLILYISREMFCPVKNEYIVEFTRIRRENYKLNIDKAADIFGWSVLMPDEA